MITPVLNVQRDVHVDTSHNGLNFAKKWACFNISPMAEAQTSLPSSPPSDLTREMFHRVVSSGQNITSRQRGDPDPTHKELMEALSAILQKQPGVFLMRFGSALNKGDLIYFAGSTDYEVVYRVKELEEQLVPRNKRRKTQNRRFECMKEMMEKTNYFSEEEMRQRNPLLFDYYVGQYMSEEELAMLDSGDSDMRLSSHIMRKMQLDEMREKLQRQSEREQEQMEEEDTSTEEEEEGEVMEGVKAEISESEKRRLRQEFLRTMQLSFLRGEDKMFDYSKVDSDERYDSISILQQDHEDAYFDAEEPQWCQNTAGQEGMSRGEQ